MNSMNNYYFQSVCLIQTLLFFCMSLLGTCQNELTVIQLKQLSARIGQAQASILDSVIDDVASNLRLSLPSVSFEPDYKTKSSITEVTPNGSSAIRETTKIAIAILRSSSLKSGINKNAENPVLVTFESVLAKINKSIDPEWKVLFVSSNVMPPTGTPNASAGMAPEAIADLDLRKRYLDLIDKNRQGNLKNGQQTALRDSKNDLLRAIADLVVTGGDNWKKSDVVTHFCKDEESKIILEKHLE